MSTSPPLALRAREEIHARNRAIVATNEPLVDDLVARHPDLLVWTPPVGGCVAFPRFRGSEGAHAFCAELVERAGVMLLPSSVYRSALADVPDTHFRIGIGRRDVPAALAALDEHLSRRPHHRSTSCPPP